MFEKIDNKIDQGKQLAHINLTKKRDEQRSCPSRPGGLSAPANAAEKTDDQTTDEGESQDQAEGDGGRADDAKLDGEDIAHPGNEISHL